MPLPQSVASLIETLGDKFDPSAIRDEANAYAETWRYYLDLYEWDGRTSYLEKHSGETDGDFELREKLSSVFNFIPTIARMLVNYLHSEQPVFSVENEDLEAFIRDCDGSGRSLPDYIRREALPLSIILGWVDSLVQNPATPADVFVSAFDQNEAEGLRPRVLTITPMQRNNWSCKRSHEYLWLRFRDQGNENPLPFETPENEETTFVTLASFENIYSDSGDDISLRDDSGAEVGYWIRSTKDNSGKWNHTGDSLPTKRVPVATLYYQQSIDPSRRHWGISKIAIIAELTRKIIQVLSWTDEDVLANLAIYAMPGDQPTDDKGQPKSIQLKPKTVLWLGKDVKIPPQVVQGQTTHLDFKLKLIEKYIQEILRLSYLIGASGEAETITSGVQGVISRNELFQELSDLAGSCDTFATDILWNAASLITGEDLSREDFIDRFAPKVEYYKGPYATEPIKSVIEGAEKIIEMFSDVSPAMVKDTYRRLAQAATYNEGDTRRDIFDEIDGSVSRRVAGDAEADALSRQAELDAIASGANPIVTGEGSE